MQVKDKSLIILLIIIIILFGIVMLRLIKDNNTCSSNPLSYSAKLLEDKSKDLGINGYALCSCSIAHITIYFDKNGVYEENPLLKGG